MLALLATEEYRHLSPKQLVPQLADQGRYLASESTMYRLKRRVGLSARRPPLLRTEVTRALTVHRAVQANQVWSWDIHIPPDPVIRGRFLRLYLVMDVWSRRIVGWEVHDRGRTHAFDVLAAQLRFVNGDYQDPGTFRRLRAALGDAARPLYYVEFLPTCLPR